MKEKFKVQIIKELSIILIAPLIATLIGLIFRGFGFPEATIIVVYMLSVVFSARFTSSYLYGILSTFFTIYTFNFFFTEPHYSLSVSDSSYTITFFVMGFSSILTSSLTFREKKLKLEALKNEKETKYLYHLTQLLNNAQSPIEIASNSIQLIYESFDIEAAFLHFTKQEIPDNSFIQRKNGLEIRRAFFFHESFQEQLNSLSGKYFIDEEFYNYPIRGKEKILGLLRLPKEKVKLFSSNEEKLFSLMLVNIALSIDRFNILQDKLHSEEEAKKEHYRANILRLISHDLRTPLTGIMGTSEMILSISQKEEEVYNFALDIYKDADYLHSLIENILSFTRLESGKLHLTKDYEVVEEIIDATLKIILKREPERQIVVDIPNDPVIIPMNAKLITQALVNLLDNAMKHSSPSEEIQLEVSIDKENKMAIFKVSDEGSGIPLENLPHIFNTFYTANRTKVDSNRSMGLGLSICKSIISVHGGNITAENKRGSRGAIFTFSLPLE